MLALASNRPYRLDRNTALCFSASSFCRSLILFLSQKDYRTYQKSPTSSKSRAFHVFMHLAFYATLIDIGHDFVFENEEDDENRNKYDDARSNFKGRIIDACVDIKHGIKP